LLIFCEKLLAFRVVLAGFFNVILYEEGLIPIKWLIKAYKVLLDYSKYIL